MLHIDKQRNACQTTNVHEVKLAQGEIFPKVKQEFFPKMAQAAKTQSFSYAFDSEINRYPRRTTGLPLSQNDLSRVVKNLRKLSLSKNWTSVHTRSQLTRKHTTLVLQVGNMQSHPHGGSPTRSGHLPQVKKKV